MLGRSLFLWGPQLPHVSGKRQMRPLLTAPHYILYRIPGGPRLPHSAPKGLHGGSAGHWTRNRGLSTSTPPPSLLVCSGSPGEFSRNLCWTRYVSYRHESRRKNRNINECSGVRQRSKRENGEQWRERAARVRGRRGAWRPQTQMLREPVTGTPDATDTTGAEAVKGTRAWRTGLGRGGGGSVWAAVNRTSGRLSFKIN